MLLPLKKEGIERRNIERLSATDIFYPLKINLVAENSKTEVKIINYHHRGACLSLPYNLNGYSLDKLKNDSLEFYLGNNLLRENIPFRICWESLNQDGMVGVEFMEPIAPFIRRAYRAFTHPHFAPLITVSDPLDPNREVFLKVYNLSETGMLLLSSLSNKHLMPGLVFKNARLTFPGKKEIKLNLIIKNTRDYKEPGLFLLGVELETNNEKFIELSSEYISKLSPVKAGENRFKELKNNQLLSKNLKSGITFKVIQTDKDYAKVLNLRFVAYQAHGKLKHSAMPSDQGEGLDKEGIIVAGFIAGEIVSTMEIRFGDGKIPLKTKSHLHGNKLIDWKKIVEFNKLAIHPSAQGSDVVVGMIQKAHSILCAAGGYDAIIMATDKLMPLYRRVGYKPIGLKIAHPHLPNESLNVMRLSADDYIHAKYINAYAWNLICEENNRFYSDMGLIKRFKLPSWKRIQIPIFRFVLKIKNRKRRRDN